MPKLGDLSQGKIYKIYSPYVEGSLVYFGSSCQKLLSKRFQNHKSCYKRYLESKCNYTSVYSLFDSYGCEDCVIELVELFPCKDISELLTRERYYIQQNHCVNKNRPICSKDDIKELARQKYQTNKSDILEKMKKQRAENPEHDRAKSKKYRETHVNEIKEKKKQYAKDNFEKLKAHRSKKLQCQCGCFISRIHMPRHQRTNKHVELLAKKEEQKKEEQTNI